jgi:hypothetical protein
MRAVKHDLYIEQGATFPSLVLELTDDAGDPLDLTDATAVAEIKTSHAASTALATFTIAFTEPRTSGELTLSMLAADTADIPVIRSKGTQTTTTRYVYDLKLTRGDGTVLRLMEGVVTVSPEVSSS